MERNRSTKEKKTIASVIKAIEVIEFIAGSENEVGVTEISNGLNYGVSATYHLLNTLKECNIVIQNEITKKYSLSLKLWQIGMLAYGQNHISVVLKPYLEKLKALTGETANLTVMDNKQIVYIAQAESNRLVKMFTTIGATAPLHCTAGGKVLLAFKPKDIRNSILDEIELIKYTENTIVNKEEFLKELEEVRKQGFAFDNQEREIGVSCIGAPIFDLNDHAIACITISGPTARFTDENKRKWVNIVLQIAEEATNHLKTIN
ncbi:IclR family transcriptional regulator [Tepidimicrobium xylanilyticum]|uniref:Transcriptional regulator, IclR family n=1 Tax=Tepidimicrobium xylanilyticum TaxID=1123352 RepID=A0A1H3A3H0_9FIRM|nr:IclR family transcriptional regulator [Tepidimicrobium xylanilyticum]GMG96337.1 IclR family transcriptional regulator [Tepidimicrobium xylanilyticum]SDX23764.1 transcriptional regulator, IclR family [Tepidimicrobium xylanilyticum]